MLVKLYLEVQARQQFLEVYFGRASWQKTSPKIVHEHNEIIEALATHQPARAQKLMTEHIHSAMVRLISVIQSPAESRPGTVFQDNRSSADDSLSSSS
jgi:DNA-binding GntR family transcriptional regulator